jgi:hypothetical protein
MRNFGLPIFIALMSFAALGASSLEYPTGLTLMKSGDVKP